MVDVKKWRLMLLSFGFLVCVLAYGSDYHSPRSAALGGSGHAGPLLNDSILLNPSFSSFLPTYSIGMSYLLYNSPPQAVLPGDQGRNYSVSIQDGRSEVFQAGAAYSKREEGSFLHLGASKAFVNRMGFGLGGKFYFTNQNHSGGRDLNFSMTAIPAAWFQSAFIADNLMESAKGKERGLYREFILGLKFNIDGILLVYLDPHYAPSLGSSERVGIEAGLEFIMASDFFLRLGYLKNATVPFQGGARGKGVGAGFGWIAPRLSIDYGFSKSIEPRNSLAHTLGATAYF
jgi:hypothetical protein